MTLLAASIYDPATAVLKSCGAPQAMTALDTTNLRVTFTVPASGKVLVRMRGAVQVNGYYAPTIMLGVLDGTTVRGRFVPMGIERYNGSGGYALHPIEVVYPITGLTASATMTWDAALSVEYPQTSTYLAYGGPDDALSGNANGAFIFEVWST